MIVGMNHFTAIAEDRKKTHAFCAGLLGLTVGDRPDLGFSSGWRYPAGPQATLHARFDRPMPTPCAGVIEHTGFTARNLRAVETRLDQSVTKCDPRRQVCAGTWQPFCLDPNGAKVGFDFDASEER